MKQSLIVLYTANLGGRLDLLPRLYTFIRQLKTQPTEDEDKVRLCALEPVPQRALLLDLGGWCAPDVWHCAATEGRSMLLALDAMGYDALHVSGQLSPQSRARLDANFLHAALVDTAHPSLQDGIAITAGDNAVLPGHNLQIILTAHERTRLDSRKLRLANVQAGQVGIIRLSVSPGTGVPVLRAHEIAVLPPDLPPAPTIAATVEYVMSEARFYERKRGGSAE